MKISEKGNLSKTYQGKYVADEKTLESIEKHLNATAGNPHKVTASDVGSYTKGEVDSKIDVINSEVGNRYTKEEVDNKLSEIGGSVDAYTKAETDDLLSDKADALELAKVQFDILGLPTFDDVYTKAETNEQVKSASRYTYYTPSTGLEIVDGVVVGIGSCRDENIIIPEFYTENGEKKPVTVVRSGVFGKLLGNNGSFIKSITFSHNIERFDMSFSDTGGNVINSEYCENLKEIYMMNPNITWQDFTYPFRLLENMKDIYFAFTEAEYDKINEGRQYTLITLPIENIQAGKVPTKHFSYFASTVVSKQIGDIDKALDSILTIQESIVGGVE